MASCAWWQWRTRRKPDRTEVKRLAQRSTFGEGFVFGPSKSTVRNEVEVELSEESNARVPPARRRRRRNVPLASASPVLFFCCASGFSLPVCFIFHCSRSCSCVVLLFSSLVVFRCSRCAIHERPRRTMAFQRGKQSGWGNCIGCTFLLGTRSLACSLTHSRVRLVYFCVPLTAGSPRS